jgi:lactoylglutathione lyase
MRITHVAIWVRDLEIMREFYTNVLGGVSGARYQNAATGFSSYFVAFGDGPRLELMHKPGSGPSAGDTAGGYGHIALALGSRTAVDDTVAQLRRQGVIIGSEPRVTGDGYYEAVVLDPEQNRVELTV